MIEAVPYNRENEVLVRNSPAEGVVIGARVHVSGFKLSYFARVIAYGTATGGAGTYFVKSESAPPGQKALRPSLEEIADNQPLPQDANGIIWRLKEMGATVEILSGSETGFHPLSYTLIFDVQPTTEQLSFCASVQPAGCVFHYAVRYLPS